MKEIAKIQKILNSTTEELSNKTGDIYINVIHNEFITINGEITIPKIPVRELDYKISVGIVDDIIPFIPQFLMNHQILVQRKPPSDQHMLQFIQKKSGRLFEFIHMFKIDLKFGGDSSNVIKKGNTDFHPSYKTDRIYYKSRLLPVFDDFQDDNIQNFKPINILESQYVESDQHFHTYALFEDANTREITENVLNLLDPDIFKISKKIYPFITFDYLTASLNILYPTGEELEKGILIFEPLFIFLFSKFKNLKSIVDIEKVESLFSELKIENDSIELHNNYKNRLIEYFHRYDIKRDDELSLKGWWKIIQEM